MPPFIPTRTELSTPGLSRKQLSLFDTADKSSASKKTIQDNQSFLENLDNPDEDSSLSDVSSQDFEDALPPSPKRRKINDKDEDDDGVDWEDAIEPPTASSSRASAGVSGDLELTLDKNAHTISYLTNRHDKKKGPSKIEREIRISTHRMHVQFLLFHNLLRSRWTSDSEVQRILVNQLPEQIRIQVDKWRTDSGFSPGQMMSTPQVSMHKSRKEKKKAQHVRSQRDWGKPAKKQEKGEPNMSAGDPIIRLIKFLAAYWKKKFTITAPGLRKQGYRSLPVLEEDIVSFRQDRHNPEVHGERIDGIAAFRKIARICEGSRDVGAQLFTALLRGLGIEARLVASLQPIGFGWSKNEDASVKKEKVSYMREKIDDSDPVSSPDDSCHGIESTAENTPAKPRAKWPSRLTKKSNKPKGANDAPIDLSEDLGASSIEQEEEDDESVVDVTPKFPREKPNMQYDRDLPAPNYWTEVISPINCQIYPVDALVSKIPIITSSEYLAQFEPRGARADKAKQIFAYVIAYSIDGTAKEVTTRYLKRHLWPGRTKGVRLPTEKIPIYNKKGKIEKYEEYDWFKTVMSGYERPYFKRTAVDDLEEEKDLKPAKFEKKEINVREDTLQFYKTSADFVLERHLRREEAIKPASKSVRTFVSGKGEDVKEEPVYRRQDIETCRTGESWHKEGRAVKPGEQPMKMVPIRAVTLTRKREVEEAERDSGEKQKQGLYARYQTDWIIPPPIENGRIPKNAYGNIDCFVPTMVPMGAVHIPLRKTVMICKKLGIDYAEAVTGFEFGNKMAVPVIEGVVVAKKHEALVIDRWEKDERERRIKEEGKREKLALGTWRKWLMGLRIIQRVREEYGGDGDAHLKEEKNPFTNQSKMRKRKRVESEPHGKQEVPSIVDDDEDMSGGFVVDNDEDTRGGGFFPESYNDEELFKPHSELVMEESEQAPQLSRRGLAVLAADANGKHHNINSRLSQPRGGKGESDAPTAQPKPTIKSEAPKESKSRAPRPQNTSKKGKKLEADFFSKDTNSEPLRSVPKRSAARKSEIAVKSQFLDHENDEDDEMGSSGCDEESQGEDMVEELFGREVRGLTHSSRRPRRARESM